MNPETFWSIFRVCGACAMVAASLCVVSKLFGIAIENFVHAIKEILK